MDQNYNPRQLEKWVLEFWRKNDINRKVREVRFEDNKGHIGFVEGPPTLNGRCHAGHSRGRALKDLWYRFMTMCGYYVLFRAGWDTQGLPVEIEVEKELNLKNKREIETRIGLEHFVSLVKETIMKYHEHWLSVDEKFGMSLDYEKEYMTYKDEYIEREWKYLKAAWDMGLLGEGYRVVAYCPGCQTSLSNTEVGLEYQALEDPSIFFKFKIKESDCEYLLLWTTMPFTIITDMLAGVNPQATYVKGRVGNETWILAKDRLEVLKELGISSFNIIGEVLGKELEGLEYEHPLLDLIDGLKRIKEEGKSIHRVVCEDFVDLTVGTGIVHLSPGNGEEDFIAGMKRDLPIFSPFNDEGRFTSDAGYFSGMFARDADTEVIKFMKQRNALVKEGAIVHEYPTCWRSHHRLIFLARREYFLWTDKINDMLVEAARKVEYYYDEPKNRFISILEEARPWCISRDRYWGTPLPIFVCTRCASKILVTSRKEIIERALSLPDGDNFELHRPWIDRVELKCDKCGSPMKRERFVLDAWHNSGAAPYASFSEDEFKKYVPVDFLTEGIDQTRGWANTLLKLNVILKGSPEAPYRAFLFQGLVLDENGRKMSKSLGNVIDSEEIIDNHSADLYRFYLTWKTAPIDPMSFSVKEMKERPFQILNTFYNLNRFFYQNASYDNYDPKRYDLRSAIRTKKLKLPDRWLLSKLQHLIESYTADFNGARYNTSLREFEDFVINTLSRSYVPAVRQELWVESKGAEKRRNAIYAVIYHTLQTLTSLLNPVAPFICEYLHQEVFRAFDPSLPESINLMTWPKANRKLIWARQEEIFDEVLKLLPHVWAARQKASMKRRWPLRQAAIIIENKRKRSILKKALQILAELSNVKRIDVFKSKRECGFALNVKLNYSVAGPKFREDLSEIEYALAKAGKKVARVLLKGQKAKVKLKGKEVELTPDDVTISWTPPPGAVVEEASGLIVVLDVTRDESLISEGLIRDIARRVQFTRKMANLNPTEILERVFISGLDLDSVKLANKHFKKLCYLIRSKGVEFVDKVPEELFKAVHPLDDQELTIALKRGKI